MFSVWFRGVDVVVVVVGRLFFMVEEGLDQGSSS